MSIPSLPSPVKLIMSLLTQKEELFVETCKRLTERFGKIDFISERLPFNYTSYYEKELGKDLFRYFISFERLISPDELVDIKLYTNSIEKETQYNDKRTINIDPGYIAKDHLILATCKPCSHRPYLRDGVYADLTLIYQNGTFKALDWTYPDYGSLEIIRIFVLIRNKYLLQLRERKTIK